MMTRPMVATLLALILPIGLAYLGLTKWLGAHIWWDVKTILFGAPIGVILSFFLAQFWTAQIKRTALWLVALILCFVIAKYGQTAFVNSYAEDQFAGKLWYFGWIATGAGTSGLIYSAITR